MINESPQALTIGGSDSDGSAGIQADLLTFFNQKVHGSSVITACVAGNSYGIHDRVLMPTSFIASQFKDLADDYQIRASKTGMLADSDTINDVAKNYSKADFGPLIVDPVIITKHGDLLLEQAAFDTLKEKLLPMATVITPNFYEAEKLTGYDKNDADFMKKAAKKLSDMGAKNIIIKGQHDDPNQTTVSDFVLLENGRTFWLEAPYHHTDRVNGTGDTLSACITAEIAKGAEIETAIRIAKSYVNQAIKNEIQVGHKFGPINHWA